MSFSRSSAERQNPSRSSALPSAAGPFTWSVFRSPDKSGRKKAALPKNPSSPRSVEVELQIPEEYEDAGDGSDTGHPLLRLILVGTTAGFPFLAELYTLHGIQSKVVKVWLEYDEEGRQYGQMFIELSSGLTNYAGAYALFRRHGIIVEKVGYVKKSSGSDPK